MEHTIYEFKIYLRTFDGNTQELLVDATVPAYLAQTIIEQYSGVNYLIKITMIKEDK